VGIGDFLRKMAPQAGLEPATLRLTGGKNGISRSLLALAAHCRIVHRGLQNHAIFDFRLVRLVAAPCRPLWRPKGKKRATRRRVLVSGV
jgi:hypothetical protein